MSKLETSESLQIPVELRRQFDRLEHRLWWVDTIIAACGAASSLMVSFLLIFLSDRLWDTPVWMRTVCTFGGFGVAIWFVWNWVQVWVLERRDIRALSGLVQRHYRRLGDRLLGIVELSNPEMRPGNVSPQLCEAAIRQVSREAEQFDFRLAVAIRKPRLYAVAGLWLFILLTVPWLLVPEASLNALARWFWPSSPVARYTFVRLHDVPSHLVVPHGEPFEIACGVSFHRFWKPSTASFRMGDQRLVRVSVSDNKVVFAIPGQTQPAPLTLKIGDVSRQLSIDPKLRPGLRSLAAKVTYPDYLEYPDQETEINKGRFSYLEGSRIAFEGETTRPLGAAFLGMKAAGAEPSGEEMDLTEQGFATPSLALKGLEEATFEWRDQYGLTSAAPWILTLESHVDGRPEVDCPEQAAVVAVLEDEILEIKAVARDDYGLRDLAMAWECRKRQETNLLTRGSAVILEGGPEETDLTGTFQFSPTLFNMPADSVATLKAVAHDYYPDRDPAESSVFRVYILSHEEHARLIQQQLERLMAELEDVTRRQEALKEAGDELARQDADGLESRQTSRQLAQQTEEQQALSNQLAQLAQKAAETLKEALRNKTIPTELLNEWAKMAEAMQSLSNQQMAKAAAALGMAQQGQTAEQIAEALQEALAMEEETLKALMELQKQIGPALDRMLSNTLANRLRRIARTEAQIGKVLESIIPEILGISPEDLEGAHRQTVQGLTGDQEMARNESQQLQEEITRFFERTSEPNFGSVSTEMKETEATRKMTELAGLIRENVSVQAKKETAVWEAQYTTWADKLEEAESEGGGGSQGGGGEMEEAALKRLLALLRIRQREQNVRAHTEILESRRETRRSYREDAIVLSIRQNYLIDDVAQVEGMGPSKFLPQVREAMGEAESMLVKPQTDKAVVDAETDAVNLLEAEIMAMMQGSSSSSMAAAMAMMMQTMGMAASAGGSFAGGSTDEANPGLEGTVGGGNIDAREVDKSVGSSTRIVPVEFREALQNFYRAVDQLEAE